MAKKLKNKMPSKDNFQASLSIKTDEMRDAIVKDLVRDAVVKDDEMRDAVVKDDEMRDAVVKDLMRDAVVKNDMGHEAHVEWSGREDRHPLLAHPLLHPYYYRPAAHTAVVKKQTLHKDKSEACVEYGTCNH